jgi:hypothetical protein
VNDDYGIGNTIIIGNGVNDVVSAIGSQHDTITLGNGDNDSVIASLSQYDTITLGNGAGDTVNTNGVGPGTPGSVYDTTPSVMVRETM